MIQIWRPFNRVFRVLSAVWSEARGGVSPKEYMPLPTPLKAAVRQPRWRGYSGGETERNDIEVVERTITVQAPYYTGLKAGDRITPWEGGGEEYEVIGDPEDIDGRHRFITFRAIKVEGGA